MRFFNPSLALSMERTINFDLCRLHSEQLENEPVAVNPRTSLLLSFSSLQCKGLLPEYVFACAHLEQSGAEKERLGGNIFQTFKIVRLLQHHKTPSVICGSSHTNSTSARDLRKSGQKK